MARERQGQTVVKISTLSLSRVSGGLAARDGSDYGVSTFQSVLVEMV